MARARSPEANGAGIRLETGSLVLERVRFDNNQVGVLSGVSGPGRIEVTECLFTRGGVVGDRPSAALMIGAVDLLVVERSTFEGIKGGQISSAAAMTVLTGNRIATGTTPEAGPAVLITGGDLVMRGNQLELGPHAPRRSAAVHAIGSSADLSGNTMLNTTGLRLSLLLDWTQSAPRLDDNTIPPGDTMVSTAGLLRHRLSQAVAQARNQTRAAAVAARDGLKAMLGR